MNWDSYKSMITALRLDPIYGRNAHSWINEFTDDDLAHELDFAKNDDGLPMKTVEDALEWARRACAGHELALKERARLAQRPTEES